ncbi:MAG TPA: GNAT family N-acetyltransferase [Candidatus Lokiarchaeia archaeon]|nr:GNAT family N-acetyltransferase [Candidatus Lokiarchaeia archaeon]
MEARLYFRDLVLDDIPAVKELVKDIWDGHDYMPRVIDRWVSQNEATVFGAFEDEAMTQLVGIARVRWLFDDMAWLEGGRVAPDLQKTGIGKALAQHSIEIAKDGGARIARYDTGMENEGSIKLAKQFGFQQIDFMHQVTANPANLSIENMTDGEHGDIRAISAEDALLAYESIENPPNDMLCAGFVWMPRTIEHFTSRRLTFIRNDSAILLVLDRDDDAMAETPPDNERWFVVYGQAAAAAGLVRYQSNVLMNESGIDRIDVFCPEGLLQSMLDIGFGYEEGIPGGTLLFEKILLENS